MQTTLSVSELIDLLLRGGTIAILLLMIAHLSVRIRFGPVILTGLIFCISGIFEAILNAPPFLKILAVPELARLALQQVHFIALWWFLVAMFDDRFKWRLPCFWPVAAAVALIAGVALTDGTAASFFRISLALLDAWLLVLIIWLAVTDPATDLVDARRAFRRVLAFSVPPFTLIVTLDGLTGVPVATGGLMCLLYAGVYFLLAVGFGFWLTNVEEGLFLREEAGTPARREERGLASADRIELERVTQAMAGGLFLEPGLTIGGLADLLRIPEHRLRRLINRGLGYRNFAAFVNDYRIEEAKRRLADPALAREQIVQHAFSLGYASLAPFNRAFRERVGVSPTEYREAALAEIRVA